MSVISISKDQSLRLKGIAILMMLFLHLFNRMSLVQQCECFLYVGETPLVNWLSRAANPVWLYLFLSGYGYSIRRKSLNDVCKSIFNIYLHWWVVLLFAFPLGLWLNTAKFNISDIWENISAWNPTYNSELWFLFPFVLLILCQTVIFRLQEKIGNKLYSILVLLVYAFCLFVFSVYGEDVVNDFSHILWIFLMVLYMFVPFSFGILFASIKHQTSNITILLLLVLTIVVKCSLTSSIWSVLYWIPFFLCFVFLLASIRYPMWLGKLLLSLGEHSLSMWFIHSFICYHIFSNQLYALKYPLLIFVVLVGISYLAAVAVDRIVKDAIAICKNNF